LKAKKLFLGLIFGALALGTAACGGPAETAPLGEVVVKEVLLKDNKIVPGEIKVEANTPVRFIVKNEGDFTHEFRIFLPTPEYVEVAPKSKDRLDVVFTKGGEYEFGCTINDNERFGMKGKLAVETVE